MDCRFGHFSSSAPPRWGGCGVVDVLGLGVVLELGGAVFWELGLNILTKTCTRASRWLRVRRVMALRSPSIGFSRNESFPG